MTKESDVKAHKKLLKDGKLHDWSAHKRYTHDGRTESDTEEHKLFKEKIRFVISSCMSIRDVLKLDNSDHIDSVTNEVEIDVGIGDKRRIDILVVSNLGRKICLECQISTLSSYELYERTYDYLSVGYEVIWIRRPGVNYQRIYYWLKDDCNNNKSYGKRKDFQLSEDIAKICKNTYKSEISKDYGYILVKFLKR